MALSTPSLFPVRPFPADTEKDFEFQYLSGNQAVRNNLVVEDIDGIAEVYNATIETFSFKHTLPANTLTNGNAYRCRIRVGDINNDWSDYSEWMVVWALSDPTIQITTIDYDNQNRVYNQTVLFEATYTQTESELLESYRYLLYDANESLLQSFPEQFANGSEPLTQEIAGLENGTLYHLEVRTLSVNEQDGTSGTVFFRPFYVSPRLTAVLTPENIKEQGAIKLSANIIQIIGKLYDDQGAEIEAGNIQYLDTTWIDLTRADYDRLVFDEGFNILQSDFLLRIWLKGISDDEVFLELFSYEGKIELKKYGDKIHAFKTINGSNLLAHFASAEIIFSNLDTVLIEVKQIEHLIDIGVEIIV